MENILIAVFGTRIVTHPLRAHPPTGSPPNRSGGAGVWEKSKSLRVWAGRRPKGQPRTSRAPPRQPKYAGSEGGCARYNPMARLGHSSGRPAFWPPSRWYPPCRCAPRQGGVGLGMGGKGRGGPHRQVQCGASEKRPWRRVPGGITKPTPRPGCRPCALPGCCAVGPTKNPTPRKFTPSLGG